MIVSSACRKAGSRRAARPRGRFRSICRTCPIGPAAATSPRRDRPADRLVHAVRDEQHGHPALPPDSLQIERICSRVSASSAPNGSSISSRPGSWTSARAMATRWRMPPDSACG